MSALLFMAGFAAPFLLFGVVCCITAAIDWLLKRRSTPTPEGRP